MTNHPDRWKPGSNDIADSVGWNIRDVHRLFAQSLQPMISGAITNISHWYYLRILWTEDGLTQQELSKRVGISPTTAVPAIDAMERHGLIVRSRHPTDRRKINIYLTPRGRSLRGTLLPAAQKLNLKATKGIPAADMATFFDVLARLKSNLEKIAEEVPGDVRAAPIDAELERVPPRRPRLKAG